MDASVFLPAVPALLIAACLAVWALVYGYSQRAGSNLLELTTDATESKERTASPLDAIQAPTLALRLPFSTIVAGDSDANDPAPVEQ